MEVIISKSAQSKIRQMAKEKGRSVEAMAAELLNEKITEIELEKPRRKTLEDLTGMFSSEKPVDTSSRASEILQAEMGLSSLGRD